MEESEESVERLKVELEHKRLEHEAQLKQEELNLKRKEIELKERELNAPPRRKITTEFVALIGVLGTILGVIISPISQALINERQADAQIEIERLKIESGLTLKAIETGGDLDKARANLRFMERAGLLRDPNHYIRNLNEDDPNSVPTVIAADDGGGQSAVNTFSATSTAAQLPAGTQGWCFIGVLTPDKKWAERTIKISDGEDVAAGKTYLVVDDVNLRDAAPQENQLGRASQVIKAGASIQVIEIIKDRPALGSVWAKVLVTGA